MPERATKIEQADVVDAVKENAPAVSGLSSSSHGIISNRESIDN